jgi:hypothetical protein
VQKLGFVTAVAENFEWSSISLQQVMYLRTLMSQRKADDVATHSTRLHLKAMDR